MENLKQQGAGRFYVNNAISKNVGGMLGPITPNNTRYIFAQGKKGGGYYEVGCVDVETGEIISNLGDDNNRDARTVIDALL